MQTIFITGGAGFIGSNLVHYFVNQTDHKLVVLDKLTYAGNQESLPKVNSERLLFIREDICNREALIDLLNLYKPDALMHLAAESHVDRSIDGPADFIKTNINGTFELLEAVRGFWNELNDKEQQQFRFLHVSTDEVYGSLGEDGYFTEDTPYRPNSPYSASKAASDHLVRAYHHTYGLPAIISNCSNNYGPRQFPEKLIPLMILNALEGKDLPVYGTGSNVRDWLYVDDHCRALTMLTEKGKPGEVYNIGGNSEKTNLEVVKAICSVLDEMKPKNDGENYFKQVSFVEDRPGHDFRYAVDTGKIREEIGWQPVESFESGLRKTVNWYLENMQWCRRVQDGSYMRERLGKGRK